MNCYHRLRKEITLRFVGSRIIALNLALSGIVVTQALNPLVDWMPYELKNYDYLKNNQGPSGNHFGKIEK